MKPVATIILNRNLPEATDNLYEHLAHYDGDVTDIYVVESGSDDSKLAKHCTWHANWPEAVQHGLRYQRGMNYGLSQLVREDKFKQYEAFLLLTNDTEFETKPSVKPLFDIMQSIKRIGILSPCSRRWGERLLLQQEQTKFFWYIHNTAYLINRKFIEDVMEHESPDYMNMLFDGTNFRGYGTESELIAKAYANDWAAAITTKVWVEENESYLLNRADQIKTESYEENMKLYLTEGKEWMRRKYGFNSHWSMQMYVKTFYNQFFNYFPEYERYKI